MLKVGNSMGAIVQNGFSRIFQLFLFLLLLIGLVSSLYLLNLDFEVLRSQGGESEHFCSVNEQFDCVVVATSSYSKLFGVPIAVFGVEFYLILLALGLLACWKRFPFRCWESHLFTAVLLSIPVCFVLAGISIFLIRSICLVCSLVHGINILLVVSLFIVRRQRLSELFFSGPNEIKEALSRFGIGSVLVFAVGAFFFSQFFWVPKFFESNEALDTAEIPLGTIKPGSPDNPIISLGSADAPVVIEEFTDFQCPFCAKAHKALIGAILKNADSIYLRHYNYPLDNSCNPNIPRAFHLDACRAARYAICVADQGHFWDYERLLFANRHHLQEGYLKQYAEEIGIDLVKLEQCVYDPKTQVRLRLDIEEATRRGIEGTPTLFINGERIVGFRPEEFWQKQIDNILHPEKAGDLCNSCARIDCEEHPETHPQTGTTHHQ